MKADDLVTQALLEIADEDARLLAKKAEELDALQRRISEIESEIKAIKARPVSVATAPIKVTGGKLGKGTLEITVTGRDEQERIKTAEVTVKTGTVH